MFLFFFNFVLLIILNYVGRINFTFCFLSKSSEIMEILSVKFQNLGKGNDPLPSSFASIHDYN